MTKNVQEMSTFFREMSANQVRAVHSFFHVWIYVYVATRVNLGSLCTFTYYILTMINVLSISESVNMAKALNHRHDDQMEGEPGESIPLMVTASLPSSLSNSLAALEQYSVLLGANKEHISQNLLEYLTEIQKDILGNNRAIAEDIIKGIKNLKEEGLAQIAQNDFKRAALREMRENTSSPLEVSLFSLCQLFANILVISYTDKSGGNIAHFRSIEQLSEIEKRTMKSTIQHVIEKTGSNRIKQLSYNIWSRCSDFTNKNEIFEEHDSMEIFIDISKLPTKESSAADVQIGMDRHMRPIHIFLWFDGSLFIRKNLQVYTINARFIELSNEQILKIKFQKSGSKTICLYDKQYNRTTDVETSYPEHIIATKDLLQAIKTSEGRYESSYIWSRTEYNLFTFL